MHWKNIDQKNPAVSAAFAPTLIRPDDNPLNVRCPCCLTQFQRDALECKRLETLWTQFMTQRAAPDLRDVAAEVQPEAAR